MNKITKRNFLNFQVLTILNFTLLDNLLIYSQPNTEIFWTSLQILIRIPSLVLVFAIYQRIVIF